MAIDLTGVVAHQELRRPRRRDQVTIPEPHTDIASLRASVMAIKELVEMLAGQRGRPNTAAVTWEDLLNLQLITNADIPKEIGSNTVQP
jgi:hypothetical protein